MTDRAVRKADAVITVSEHARRKIAATGRVNANHIVSIHSAVAPDLQRVTDPQVLAEVRERYGLMKGFVLADALKNPAVLIRAWQQLSPDLRDGQEVVFFCRHSNPPLPVAQAVKEGTARLLVRPSRADLTALYSMATVFVFPSWIEGFGLPVLEAMRCGAPVISSDRGSLPEVVGDAALLMDAEDDTALAGYLTAVFSQPEVAESLRIKGSERSALFSWERAASQVLDIYSHVVSASPLVLRYVRA
jgi:glycosyltransferase involved in cell wall biosynthesis